MSSFRRLYLDANIFIELAEGQGEQQQLLYRLVARQMLQEDLFLSTSELTLAELLVLPQRQGHEALVQLYDGWIVPGNPWLEVGPVTREVLWAAALIRQQFSTVKLPDAIHIATALGCGCSHFLTYDKRIPREIHVTKESPERKQGSPVLEVVTPTISLLHEVLDSRSKP